MNPRAARGSARVEAQAKINLLLRVREREPTGYHQIVTLFQRIALADTVTVRTTVNGRALDVRGADTGPVEQNLAWRAALAFTAAAKWPGSFAIEIEKRIPVGGGLGGGSADAAAVLRALCAIVPEAPGQEALKQIALELGADVPYLLSELPLALGAGRGERLIALAPLAARDVVLLVPPFGISSGDAFGWFDASPHPANHSPQIVPSPIDWKIATAHAANDLEATVFAHHPDLAMLRDAIEASGAFIARMSGSGSTLFGVYEPAAPDAVIRRRERLGQLGVLVIETATVDNVARVEQL